MRLLIYGTGVMAKKYLEGDNNNEILGFIETYATKKYFYEKPVYCIDNIPKSYDYIIVTPFCADEIYEILMQKKVDINKCIFWNKCKYIDFVSESNILAVLGEKNYAIYSNNYGEWRGTYFEKDLIKYTELNTRDDFAIQEKYLYPIITDKYCNNSGFDAYFWQDLWAAKKIISSGILKHYDIGSRIDGFVAHLLAASIQVNVIDIRNFSGECENLYTVVDDATELKQFDDNSIPSLSAMCSIEHFGLGRYGDPIDPEACFNTFKAAEKKLACGGMFYFSVPVGTDHVEFNAHRVFTAKTIIDLMPNLELVEYSAIVDKKIKYDCDIHEFDELGDEHVIGLFCMKKI